MYGLELNGGKIEGVNKMKLSKYSYQVTQKEADKIRKNLEAFIFQFGFEPILRKDKDKNFYIFLSAEAEEKDEYIQRCENIDYLNGWLYGAVQTICKSIQRINTKNYFSMEKLVGKRFNNLKEIKKEIEKIKHKKIVGIFESESERPKEIDFMIDYEFDEMDDVYTIFYLKDNAGHYYITEV